MGGFGLVLSLKFIYFYHFMVLASIFVYEAVTLYMCDINMTVVLLDLMTMERNDQLIEIKNWIRIH
jgi:hypothetical protein